MSFVHRQLLTALPRRSSRRTFISCPGNLKLLDSHSPSSPTTRTRTKSRRSSFVPQPHSKSEDPGPAATDDSEPAPVKLRHDDTEMDSASPRLTPWIKQLMDEIHTENGGSSSCSVAPSGIGNTFSLAGPNRTTATTTSMAIYDSFSVHNNPVSTTATTSDNDDDDDDDDERGNPLHNNKTISKLNEDPKICWPVDPNLYHHVRACLSDIEYEDPELATRDTGLSVCTLGTGAGNASKLRANTSTVIRAGSHSYLIDAGEGVQRQFLASRISFRDVRKIFITHMHGDHVFGLPSFLLNLQIAGLLANEQRTVEIYGPVGLFNYIATSLSLTGTELRKMTVEVYELHGGTQRSMRHQCNRRTFPEFFHQVRTCYFIE